jgi:hypothetical protein
MYPNVVDWQKLRFGVELEFVDGDPDRVELLPGWVMKQGEQQDGDDGRPTGAELSPPPLTWADRDQIRVMAERLRLTGARASWSCGLHVHVGLEPWGQEVVLPLLDAALACQDGLRALLKTAAHRLIFCPPVTPAMRQRYLARPERASLIHWGRPQSHRCGINAAAWFDKQTVEIRYPNGSLDGEEILRTVELCLRFVAAVGAGRRLPPEPLALAEALGAPVEGYPPPVPAPLWHLERMWLEEALLPVLAPRLQKLAPHGEILQIRPVPGGLRVEVEFPNQRTTCYFVRPSPSGWELAPA